MNMQKPDSVTVVITRREELLADQVDLIVTTKGSSLVTGRDVLKHVPDLAQQFSTLEKHGIRQEDLDIQGIFGEGMTGSIGRASAATYQVRIRCAHLEALPDILGIVTLQRHARVSAIQWRFSNEDDTRDACLKACVAGARRKAELIAGTLGVPLLGLQSLSERWQEAHQQFDTQPPQPAQRQPAMLEQSSPPGFPLFHAKTLTLNLKAVFHIGSFGEKV